MVQFGVEITMKYGNVLTNEEKYKTPLEITWTEKYDIKYTFEFILYQVSIFEIY